MVVGERIRFILRFVVIGAGYGYWTSIAAAAGLRGLIRGALTGVLIGAAVSSLRTFVLQAPGTRLSRASFMVTVAVRSLVCLVVFLAAIAVGQILVPNHPPVRTRLHRLLNRLVSDRCAPLANSPRDIEAPSDLHPARPRTFHARKFNPQLRS